jgi:P-type E1-E2 ATPase
MSIILDHDVALSERMRQAYEDAGERSETAFFVVANRSALGVVSVADVVRPEAKESMRELKELGIEIVMLTGDNQVIAKETADALGIEHFRASLKPEDKLREIERLLQKGTLAMVGDGINDAPALSRADVGIAMGGEGTAVAVEAADIVILTDDLSRLPAMIRLGRNTRRVVHTDMILWAVTNVFGFCLVLAGFAGLAFAAFYNFATDFVPLGNSALFFRDKGEK